MGKFLGIKDISQKSFFKIFFLRGIHLVTKLKKNMKTKSLTPMFDAYMIRKRAIVETIFDQLKNICLVEHSRHRSIANYFNTIFSVLIAYNFMDKKTSLKNNFVDTKQLYLFHQLYRTHVSLIMIGLSGSALLCRRQLKFNQIYGLSFIEKNLDKTKTLKMEIDAFLY